MPPSGWTKLSRYFRLRATSGSSGERPFRSSPVVTRAVTPMPAWGVNAPSGDWVLARYSIALATMASILGSAATAARQVAKWNRPVAEKVVTAVSGEETAAGKRGGCVVLCS